VRRIWKRRDKLDSLLRANAPEPRDEFVRAVARGIGGRRAHYGGRLAIAAAVMVVAIAAFGAFGGLSYAAKAVSQATGISSITSSSPNGDKPPKGDQPKGNDQSGDKSQGNDQSGDKSQGNDQSGDKSQGNDQSGDKSQGDDQSGDKSKGDDQSGEESESNNASDDQYAGKTTICHRTSSQKNPFVLITVSNNALPAHKAHGDTLPAADGSCPGPPIP
jgi:hypothetical protein